MRDLSKQVRGYVYGVLNGNITFDSSSVPVVAKPTERTTYPFIQVMGTAFTDDGTKDAFAGVYQLEVRVNTRYRLGFGGQDDADDISNDVLEEIRVRNATDTFNNEDCMYIFKQTNQRWEEDDDGKFDYHTKVLTFEAYVTEIVNPTSTEAQAVIDRMLGLTSTQETAIKTFVDAEVSAGNWSLTDEFWCLCLGFPNALIGFKSFTATNNGAAFDVGGALFNGSTQFIDSVITPSTDLTQASLNDIDVQCFVKENYDTSDVVIPFGSKDSNHRIWTYQRNSVNTLAYSINANSNSAYNAPQMFFQDETLYGISRENSSSQSLLIDGLQVDLEADVSTGIPTESIFIGCYNNNGAAQSHINAKISTFKIGAAIGFDQAAHNTNVRILLTTLGAI